MAQRLTAAAAEADNVMSAHQETLGWLRALEPDYHPSKLSRKLLFAAGKLKHPQESAFQRAYSRLLDATSLVNQLLARVFGYADGQAYPAGLREQPQAHDSIQAALRGSTTVHLPEGEARKIYSHAECLKTRLHPSVPVACSMKISDDYWAWRRPA